MSRKQRIIVSVTGIFLVLLILVGLTYAYFLTKIKGNTNSKSISVVTANLLLEYADVNDELITDSAVEPGKTWTKTFVATNKGNKTVTYGVALENVVNTLERKEDLVYTLDCKQYSKTDFAIDKTNKTVTGTISGTCNGVSEETTFPTIGTILVENDIADDKAQVYTLVVTYKETNTDQSVDMNKTFSAKANIVDPNNFKPYGTNTLATAIIDSAKNATGDRTVYRDEPLTIPGQQTSQKYYTDKVEESSEISSNIDTKYQGYYWTYGTDYTIDENTGNFTLTGVSTCKYNDGTCNTTLVEKYLISSYDYRNSSSTNTAKTITNISNIYKVTEAPVSSKSTITMKVKELSATAYSLEKTLSKAQDDYGDSYYFRGNVVDNFVNYAGMCWRIVRIQGDGSIKLILASELSCSDTNVTTSSGYATDGAAEVQGTILNGIIWEFGNYSELNTWLSTKITTNNDKALLKRNNWCIGDRTSAYIYNSSTKKYELSKMTAKELLDNYTEFDYSTTKRRVEDKTPKLKCDGNDMEKGEIIINEIGLLTADEIMFAGAAGGIIRNSTYYLNQNATSNSWWTSSPGHFNRTYVFVGSHCVNEDGVLSQSDLDYWKMSFRPVITLVSNIQITSGDGTVNNAYTVG